MAMRPRPESTTQRLLFHFCYPLAAAIFTRNPTFVKTPKFGFEFVLDWLREITKFGYTPISAKCDSYTKNMIDRPLHERPHGAHRLPTEGAIVATRRARSIFPRLWSAELARKAVKVKAGSPYMNKGHKLNQRGCLTP